MKLTDFNQKTYASKALQENYNVSLNVTKLSLPDTKNMLKKIRTLATEAKQQSDFYKNQAAPSYMKLVFMEEALVNHFNSLISNPIPQIVVENEEVEKSQVVLAAQDMVDTVQKMIEQVSDMLVKELPALVESIQSEIGVNESEQFNQQATEALTNLQSTLTQSKASMQGALNIVTGQGAEGFDAEEPMPAPGEEEVTDVSVDQEELPAELPTAPEELPEPAGMGGAGRARR